VYVCLRLRMCVLADADFFLFRKQIFIHTLCIYFYKFDCTIPLLLFRDALVHIYGGFESYIGFSEG